MESLVVTANSKFELEILQRLTRKNAYICRAKVQIHD